MKLERIIAIIMLLLEQKKISATKLAKMFEVTPRTIYRDIDTINAAGIPIVSYLGVNGGIGIMEEYKIEKKLFTMSDITSLLIGLGSIPLTSEEILNAIAKVKGLVPKEQIYDIEAKSNKIMVDYTTWYGYKALHPRFEEIKIGLDENRYLLLEYSDHNGKVSERKIEPYRLILKQPVWYLQGYCVLRQDLRTFRLSRILSFKLLDETFIPRKIELKTLGETNMLESQRDIQLLVDESLRGWMIDFCGEECVQSAPDNKVLVSFPFAESEYGYSVLLRFGDKCECLAPEEVRQEVIRRVRNHLNLYQ